MASIDTIGLVNIIDECFDNYKNIHTPYIAEENASIFSFLKKSYAMLKDGSMFENQQLLEVYKECVRKILIKLNQIENRKVYQYSFKVDISRSRIDYFTSFFEEMWKYVDRHFPNNLTENEIKIGYYETIDGETFFNGYRENIVIGGKLKPSYEDDKVVYKIEDNPYCIKMNGIVKPNERPSIQLFINGNEHLNSPFYSLYDFLKQFKTLNETIISKFYSINDETAPRMYFAFSNGFVINDMNEYENPNGVIYDIFNSLGKSLENSEKNYFKDFLKNYLYTGIINRYREKTFDDKKTSLVMNDLNFGRFDNVIPGVNETLSGKGGNIGGLQTIYFDNRTVLGKSEYVRLMFDKSYYNPENNKIEIYINKKFLKGNLSKISNFNGIYGNSGSYLSYVSNIYNQLKYYDGFEQENIKFLNKEEEIEETLLKEELFAVEPWFWPKTDNNNNVQDTYWDSDFFTNNIKKIQKVYFYDDDSYLKEDDLLKELSAIEGGEKQFVKSQRNRNISIGSDEKNLIIYLQNYIDGINEKKYLGSGYINIKKVPQKFKDNKVSKLVDNEYTNKNSYFESEEFSSALDDREITIIHTTPDMFITQTENGFLPSFTGTYLDCEKHNKEVKFVKKHTDLYRRKEFPEFKIGTLYDAGEFLELECTNFADYVDIGSLRQIRIMSINSNSARYLFNIKGIKKNKTCYQTVNAYFNNLEDLNAKGYSFPINNILNLSNKSVEAYSIKNKFISIKDDNKLLFEKFVSNNNAIDINWIDEKNDLKTKNYVIDINTEDIDGKPNNTALIINDNNKYEIKEYNNNFQLELKDIEFEIEENFYFEYRLLLQKNEYVKNMIFENGQQVYILDYIQMSGRPERKEFHCSTYKDNGQVDVENYVPEKEKINLFFLGLRKNITAYMLNPVCILNSLKQLSYILTFPTIKIGKAYKLEYKLNKNWKLKNYIKNFYIIFKFLKDFYLIPTKFVARNSRIAEVLMANFGFKDEIEPSVNSRNRVGDNFGNINIDVLSKFYYQCMKNGKILLVPELDKNGKPILDENGEIKQTTVFKDYDEIIYDEDGNIINNSGDSKPESEEYLINMLLRLLKEGGYEAFGEDIENKLESELTYWYDDNVFNIIKHFGEEGVENDENKKYYTAFLYKENSNDGGENSAKAILRDRNKIDEADIIKQDSPIELNIRKINFTLVKRN